ncbi:hypothetical protein AB0M20_12075 [Actinoplanes sp. NPDC051633]|uniref:hypothetical protein n=1 Tax=Actinoplanes sp. NPDC051633 TaxID=3155670 RepID=UPI00342D7EB5
MTQWTVAIPAASLFVATVAAFFAVRAHMRSLNRLRLGYGFTEPVTVGMKPDPVTGVDEANEFEVVLRNLSREVIKADEFSGQPIVVRLGARVLEVSGVTSRPRERVRPKVPVADGTKILIDPFAFCLGQEVRIRVKTDDPPRDARVEADAPAVLLHHMRRR